jgi:hypothetical protein
MATFVMKSWSHFFDAIVKREKRHDLRKMDRPFKIGDVLELRRFDNIKGEYTGEVAYCEVTYITSKDTPCAFSSAVLDDGFCILSLKIKDMDFV